MKVLELQVFDNYERLCTLNYLLSDSPREYLWNAWEMIAMVAQGMDSQAFKEFRSSALFARVGGRLEDLLNKYIQWIDGIRIVSVSKTAFDNIVQRADPSGEQRQPYQQDFIEVNIRPVELLTWRAMKTTNSLCFEIGQFTGEENNFDERLSAIQSQPQHTRQRPKWMTDEMDRKVDEDA